MSCKLRNTVAMLALSLAVVWCMPAFGQVVKGSISGTVTDPQGAVVSGATVKATNTATGVPISATTTSDGEFSFQDLPLGTYKIEVSSAGFRPVAFDNVTV